MKKGTFCSGLNKEEIKEIWNEAVKATLREVNRYDGIIISERDREYLIQKVSSKVSYKIKNENPNR
jgi:hypothetical protein